MERAHLVHIRPTLHDRAKSYGTRLLQAEIRKVLRGYFLHEHRMDQRYYQIHGKHLDLHGVKIRFSPP